MKIFFDTEFIDTGSLILPLSFGLVREDNAIYYAEPAETDRSLGCEWVQKNVIPFMKGPVKPLAEIRTDIVDFCGYRPEFWTYFGSYDWLVMCQLFGRMLDVPYHWPNHMMDIQQYRLLLHPSLRFPIHDGQEHNALDDAIWTKKSYEFLNNYAIGRPT